MPVYPLLLIVLLQLPQIQPRYERLDNELRVAIVEDHTLPLASVQLWYRAGSACDPPARPGLCSVARSILEHRDDSALRLRAAGVRFKSRTLRDACYFSSVLPPDFLEYALDIEAARMQPLRVTPETVKLGLQGAARDYADLADDPNHVLMRQVLSAMFPDHPYRHPPGFVAESLKGLSPKEVNEFLARWFVPGNATLLVIGDVSPVQVLEQVRRRFDALEWTERPRWAEPNRLPAKTIRICVPHPNRAAVTIAWRTPPLGYFENAAIDVLMQHLCNEVDGPLRQALRKGGVPFAPTWRRYAWRGAGMLVLSVDYWSRFARPGGPRPPPGKSISNTLTESIVGIVDEVLRESESRIPTEIQHNRARALAEAAIRTQRAALPDRARMLARHEVVAGDLLLAEFGEPRVRGVGVLDVQMAARLLNGARCVIVENHPDPSLLKHDARSDLAAEPLRVNISPIEFATLFDQLTEYTSAAPEITPPQHHPTVDVNVRGRITTRTCRIPAMKDPVLLTLEVRPTGTRSRLERHRGISPEPDSRSLRKKVLDYLSYHGITIDAVIADGASGYACLLPNGREESAAAWQGGLLRRRARTSEVYGHYRSVELIVVGDTSPGRARQIAEEFWADWNPPAPDAEDIATQPNVRQPGLQITWVRDAKYPGKVMLRLRIELADSETLSSHGGSAQDALALLLGRVSFGSRAWGAADVTPWQSWNERGNALTAEAVVSRAALRRTVESMLSRIRSIRAGLIPKAHIETALHLARSERLVSLDSGWAIAEALWQRWDNPWDVDAQLTPDDFVATVTPALQSAAVWIDVHSAEDLSEELAGLESELSASRE